MLAEDDRNLVEAVVVGAGQAVLAEAQVVPAASHVCRFGPAVLEILVGHWFFAIVALIALRQNCAQFIVLLCSVCLGSKAVIVWVLLFSQG